MAHSTARTAAGTSKPSNAATPRSLSLRQVLLSDIKSLDAAVQGYGAERGVSLRKNAASPTPTVELVNAP